MDYDVMKIFVSEEAALSFCLGFGKAFLLFFSVAFIFGIVDILVSKYKKKHDLK